MMKDASLQPSLQSIHGRPTCLSSMRAMCDTMRERPTVCGRVVAFHAGICGILQRWVVSLGYINMCRQRISCGATTTSSCKHGLK